VSETKRDYQVGRGKPPVHSRFKKGQSGNLRGPRPKSLPCRVKICPASAKPIRSTAAFRRLFARYFGRGHGRQGEL